MVPHIQQLLNSTFGWYEEFCRSRNSADQKCKMDNTLWDLQNSSYPMKAEFSNCFIIYSKFLKEKIHCKLFDFLFTKNITTSSPGFLHHQFNDLQRAALLTSLIQYDVVLSKFGVQQQVMVNYTCGFNQ